MTHDPVDIQAFARSIHELLVLDALRPGPRHGYQIALDVEQRSAGRFILQHGTLYPILHRLEAEKLISGRWEATAARRRRTYRLTAAGRRRLETDARRVAGVLEYVRTMGGGQSGEDVLDAS